MVLTKKGSVLSKSHDGDTTAGAGGKGTWQKKGKNKQQQRRSQAESSPVKFLDSDPPSPCVVCKAMVDDEGIRCNRCSAWAHGTSHGGCSGLSPSVFEFMVNSPVDAIKWYCPVCEKDSDRKDPNDKLAEQLAKLDTLTAVVLTLQQQNAIILEMLKNERSIEQKVKIQVTEVLDSQKEREGRVNNIVVFNVSESQGTDQAAEKTHDKNEIKNILTTVHPDLDLEKVDVDNVIRLGRRKDPSSNPRPRPIKVVFKDREMRNSVLRKAWRLKDHDHLRKVGISADKTLKERNDEKAIRQEYMRRKQGGEDVVMHKGQVMTKTEREMYRKGDSASTGEGGGGLGDAVTQQGGEGGSGSETVERE